MRTLLLTRPRAQSEAFAADLEARLPGRFRPVVSPLIEIVRREVRPDLAGFAALAFTSANAVAAFAALSPDRRLPAYCVGDVTADAARAAGFSAHSAGGDARALAALIARDRPAGAILHLRGERAAADLAALLAPHGVAARDLVLYDQRAAVPTAEARALGEAGRLDVVALFSPRSARLLAAAAQGWNLAATTAVAISPAADAVLARLAPGLDPARRRIAASPSREGMIAALAGL